MVGTEQVLFAPPELKEPVVCVVLPQVQQEDLEAADGCTGEDLPRRRGGCAARGWGETGNSASSSAGTPHHTILHGWNLVRTGGPHSTPALWGGAALHHVQCSRPTKHNPGLPVLVPGAVLQASTLSALASRR